MNNNQGEENRMFWDSTFGMNTDSLGNESIFDKFLVTLLICVVSFCLFSVMTAIAYKSGLYAAYLLAALTVGFPLFFICRFIYDIFQIKARRNGQNNH